MDQQRDPTPNPHPNREANPQRGPNPTHQPNAHHQPGSIPEAKPPPRRVRSPANPRRAGTNPGTPANTTPQRTATDANHPTPLNRTQPAPPACHSRPPAPPQRQPPTPEPPRRLSPKRHKPTRRHRGDGGASAISPDAPPTPTGSPAGRPRIREGPRHHVDTTSTPRRGRVEAATTRDGGDATGRAQAIIPTPPQRRRPYRRRTATGNAARTAAPWTPACAGMTGKAACGNAPRLSHLVIAQGEPKAAAPHAALAGPVTVAVPASALQLHPAVTVVADRPAATGLWPLGGVRRVRPATCAR